MTKSRKKTIRNFAAGDRVEILRKDINWGKRKKQRYGYITRVNGAYHYVRPLWWKADEVMELYPNEIRLAPLSR